MLKVSLKFPASLLKIFSWSCSQMNVKPINGMTLRRMFLRKDFLKANTTLYEYFWKSCLMSSYLRHSKVTRSSISALLMQYRSHILFAEFSAIRIFYFHCVSVCISVMVCKGCLDVSLGISLLPLAIFRVWSINVVAIVGCSPFCTRLRKT